MIEAAAAQDLIERLRHVEDRMARLFVSGWRQAHGEAADLRAAADGLSEAGLTEVAARITAVAEARTAAEALPGRSTPIPTAERHFVNGHPLKGPWPEGLRQAMFGLGCFWGAERKFW